MASKRSSLRGIIIGIDTIGYSRNPTILRQRNVIVDPTPERLAALAITDRVIDESLIATTAQLKPVLLSLPGIDTPTIQSLNRALIADRVLHREKLSDTLSNALPDFLKDHGFYLPQDSCNKLMTKGHRLKCYITYGEIAQILSAAGIPVYYISAQKGPEYHSVWTTP